MCSPSESYANSEASEAYRRRICVFTQSQYKERCSGGTRGNRHCIRKGNKEAKENNELLNSVFNSIKCILV